MSGHRPFSELTKDFTEERWQHVATKRAKQDEVSRFYISPSEKERKPKMSVSAASSYFQKKRSLLTRPISAHTQPVTELVSLKNSLSKHLAKIKDSFTRMNPRISTVTAIEGYRLRMLFDNDERRVYDCSRLLNCGVFKELQDSRYFERAKAVDGTVVWPHGQDICPDTLYLDSVLDE